MGGYLDTYGAGDVRRERNVKRIVLLGLLLLFLALLVFFFLRTWTEERRVSRFLDHLRAGDYRAAHALWGCTEATPCRDYSYEKFLEDWGPRSRYGNANSIRVVNTIGCDASVIQTLEAPGAERLQLRVDRKDKVIGFAPWPITLQEDGLYFLRAFVARLGLGSCAPRR